MQRPASMITKTNQTADRCRAERIGIVGAGIGGLAAAIALRRLGKFEVVVFERVDAPSPRGAALLIWSNALLALASVGLAEAVQ
ncbi:MAG TPA: NAD(P)-binding protein, partial [Labilithrix sp.]|nr:NAD(P)-binding protein [Labilithrix sp.]